MRSGGWTGPKEKPPPDEVACSRCGKPTDSEGFTKIVCESCAEEYWGEHPEPPMTVAQAFHRLRTKIGVYASEPKQRKRKTVYIEMLKGWMSEIEGDA
jgi:hypothetical protein